MKNRKFVNNKQQRGSYNLLQSLSLNYCTIHMRDFFLEKYEESSKNSNKSSKFPQYLKLQHIYI